MEKKKAAKLVKSTLFKRIFLVIGIIFLILTCFITVNPNAFIQYGYFGVFLFNIFSTSLLIMPTLIDRMDLWGIVFFSALGNVPNTSINYLVGNTTKHLFPHNTIIGHLKKWMRKYGLIVVYLLGIVPTPIDVNGLLAGYLDIPYPLYLVVNFLGRATSFLLAGLGVITYAQAMK